MVAQGPAKQLVFSATGGSFRDDAERLYVEHYAALDPKLPLAHTVPPGDIFFCHRFFDDRFVATSEFYNDFLIPIGSRYIAGCTLWKQETQAAYVGVHRNQRQGPFEDDGTLRMVIPHLRRASLLNKRLRDLERLAGVRRAALDALPYAVIVTDARRIVFDMNAPAEAMLRESDALVMRDQCLFARNPANNGRLSILVRDAVAALAGRAPGGGALRLHRRDDRTPLFVRVLPLAAQSPLNQAWQAPLAMIVVTDPESTPIPPERILTDLFALSPAEAQVALMLAAGQRLGETAERRRTGLETVRTQVKAIMAKTGTARQAELVRLLTRIAH